MDQLESAIFHRHQRSGWVRLRTLVTLRWFAIAGQVLAVLVAQEVFDVHVARGPVAITIGLSVLANLISIFVYPENRRLSESEATAMMVLIPGTPVLARPCGCPGACCPGWPGACE